MPSSASPELIVARYLKSNNYTNTLNAFLQEAGLPPDCGTVKPGDWTIENILEEKRQFDASIRFEKIREDDGERAWLVPAPRSPTVLTPPSHLANVLCVTAVQYPRGDTLEDALLVSLANRDILAVSLRQSGSHSCEWKATGSSPILSITRPNSLSGFLTTEMSGKLSSWEDNAIDDTARLVETRQDHNKYAVKVVHFEHDSLRYLATAGWDQKVHVYCSTHNSSFPTAPSATLTIQTNPECLMFALNPDTGVLYLIISRRDSTHLLYYTVTATASPTTSSDGPVVTLTSDFAGRQNLAPHANAWVSFSPSHFLPHPLDPTLIAIATNHLPHMKLLVVRLLFPSSPSSTTTTTPSFTPAPTSLNPPSSSTSHPAAQALAALDLQNREDAAIKLHASTQAPQTPYSTPQLAWRPDGSGIWVNGDDGVVRGIEVATGKVVQVLGGEKEGGEAGEGGHEAGSKIRSLWAGRVRCGDTEEDEEEVVVSGGFDKRVILWRIKA